MVVAEHLIDFYFEMKHFNLEDISHHTTEFLEWRVQKILMIFLLQKKKYLWVSEDSGKKNSKLLFGIVFGIT